MQIHRWQRRLALPQPVALTIGNFDGVHRGHQAILQTLLAEAAREDLAPVLLSFFPASEGAGVRRVAVAFDPPARPRPLARRSRVAALAAAVVHPCADAESAGRFYPRLFVAVCACVFVGRR